MFGQLVDVALISECLWPC